MLQCCKAALCFAVSLITAMIQLMLPGRELITFYICSGQDPRMTTGDDRIKSSPVFAVSFGLTFLTYTFTLIRLKLFTQQEEINNISAQVQGRLG